MENEVTGFDSMSKVKDLLIVVCHHPFHILKKELLATTKKYLQ